MTTSPRATSLRRRHRRVRKKVSGSPGRPRLAVFRSNRHIYAQVIDDEGGITLASASTLKDGSGNSPKERAKSVGQAVGQRAKAAGITKVSFDRGGFMYHGRVESLAEGAREAGLEF